MNKADKKEKTKTPFSENSMDWKWTFSPNKSIQERFFLHYLYKFCPKISSVKKHWRVLFFDLR
jgi:hypothetical protein